MNEYEIIKKENNSDEVVRMHTHDSIKINFYLKVSFLEYL